LVVRDELFAREEVSANPFRPTCAPREADALTRIYADRDAPPKDPGQGGCSRRGTRRKSPSLTLPRRGHPHRPTAR
jgi:hypothetical protein